MRTVLVVDATEWVSLGEELRRTDPELFLRLYERMRRVVEARRDVDRTSVDLFCSTSTENSFVPKKVS